MNRQAKLLSSLLVLVLGVGIATWLWSVGSVVLPNYATESFVNDLRAEGAIVQMVSDPPSDEHWFPVEPRRILVNSESVSVYEFQNNLQAFRAALAVEPHGSSIRQIDGVGGVMIEWVAAPHWYRRGQLIVLHVALNSKIDNMLQKHLGKQFAGQ